jgi:hypothetical protein
MLILIVEPKFSCKTFSNLNLQKKDQANRGELIVQEDSQKDFYQKALISKKKKTPKSSLPPTAWTSRDYKLFAAPEKEIFNETFGAVPFLKRRMQHN